MRDAAVRFNAEGLAGLHNTPHPGPAPRLDAARRTALRQLILDGPDMEPAGLSAWILPELCQEVERRWASGSTLAAGAHGCAGWACRARRPGLRTPSATGREGSVCKRQPVVNQSRETMACPCMPASYAACMVNYISPVL